MSVIVFLLLIFKDSDELVMSVSDSTAVTFDVHSLVTAEVTGIVEALECVGFGCGFELDVDANLFKLGHSYYLTFWKYDRWDVAWL